MANVDGMIREAIASFKAGRKSDAKQLLLKATELDESNEQAWLWLSGCVDTPEEQEICLENVLAINPGNTKARKGLEAVRKQGKQKPAAPPPEPSYGSSSDDDLFAGTGFASAPAAPPSSTPDPAFDTGWDTFTPAPNSAPAAYGSGRDVKLPSDHEYDRWIEGMGFGSAADTGTGTNVDLPGDPFGNQAEPFDSGFGSDLFSSSSPGGDAYGGTPAPSPTDDFGDFGSGPFQAPSSSFNDDLSFSDSSTSNRRAFSSANETADDIFSNVPSSAKNNPLGNPKNRAQPASNESVDDGLGDLRSDFLGSSSADDPFSEPEPAPSRRSNASTFGDQLFAPAESDTSTVSGEFMFGARPSPKSTASIYFKSIPDEIQVSRRLNIKLVATLIVLGLLNAVSLALLFLNLKRS